MWLGCSAGKACKGFGRQRLTALGGTAEAAVPTLRTSAEMRRNPLRHPYNRQRLPVPKRNLLILGGFISLCAIKSHAAQGCAHLKPRESCFSRGVFTGFENQATNTAASPFRMYEECSNFRVRRIDRHHIECCACSSHRMRRSLCFVIARPLQRDKFRPQ